MFEYRKIKHDDSILNIMWKDYWELVQILWEVSYWKRKINPTRKKPEKKEFEEQLFYNKSYIKWCCSYVFDDDFQKAYEEWREERKLSPSYKTLYNEASEKRTFNKLAWKPKQISLKMLENASANKWLILYDLQHSEEEQILNKLREQNHKIEIKQQWIESEQEFEKAKEEKQRLNEYIEQNPHIREEAKKYVLENNPWVEWVYRETLIMAKARMIAKNKINSL